MAKLTGIKAVLADRKRLAKWRASPGLRSKLPDEVLTREQRLQRRLHRPVFDGGPTGFDVARGARTATDLAYGGQRQALREERTQVAAQRMRNAGWWDQYQNMLRSQVGSVQANPTVSPNVLGQYGARPDAGTVGVQQGAQGAQAALASLANGLLQAQAQTATQRKMESLAGFDAKELALTRKSGDLEREAGLFKQQQREKIVGDAWQKLLEGKAFDLKAFAARSDAATDAAKVQSDARDKAMNRSLKRQELAEKTRHNQAMENKPSGRKKGKDRSQKWDEANAMLRGGKTPWLDGKGNLVYYVNGKTVSVPKGRAAPEGAQLRTRPFDAGYAKSHREQLIDMLVLKKIPRDLAARAVDRMISTGSTGSAVTKAPR